MAKVKLDFQAEVDLLNEHELKGALDEHAIDAAIERGRGIKIMRFSAAAQASVTSNTGSYTIPATPDSGYVWNLRTVGATVNPAATIRFWIGTDLNTGIPSPNTLMPLGQSGSAQPAVLNFGSGQMFMKEGEYIVISASAGITLNTYLVWVVQTPAELAWKLT